jgi:hypothetical protein
MTALLLASSGAADSNLPEWMQAWDSQMVLLSVASGDRRARPAPEVLQARTGLFPTTYGSEWLGASEHGWVEDVGGGGEEVG